MPVVAESVKPASSSSEGEKKHKHVNREVRDMVSAITTRLANIHKVGGSGQGQEESDIEDNGVKIITLGGTNTGANLRGELDDKSASGDNKPMVGETEALRTYVNSNFQAVNNSIMMGGSYSANDPGVHVEITDDYYAESKDKKVSRRKGKKKMNKEGFKSDETSSSSGSESSD